MKLRLLALLSALLVAPLAAHAQSAAYAMFDAQQFTRSGLYVAPPSGVSNSDSPWLYGTTFGAYYTITRLPFVHKLPTGPVAVALDGRGTIVRTHSPYSRDEAIVSLRLSPKNPFMNLKPYIQGGAGVGHTKVPGQTYFTNSWNYDFAVGADHKLTKMLDLRVEVSGGFMGDYRAGNSVNNSNHLLNFASGVVVHIP